MESVQKTWSPAIWGMSRAGWLVSGPLLCSLTLDTVSHRGWLAGWLVELAAARGVRRDILPLALLPPALPGPLKSGWREQKVTPLEAK